MHRVNIPSTGQVHNQQHTPESMRMIRDSTRSSWALLLLQKCGTTFHCSEAGKAVCLVGVSGHARVVFPKGSWDQVQRECSDLGICATAWGEGVFVVEVTPGARNCKY